MTLRTSIPWFFAAAVFALAYWQPVQYTDSDPAIALLVTQSLLDHQTWRLDAYKDDPACAYDLETDYRIRRHDGSYFYYSYGVPLVSLPWVWLANRAGYHMLDQADEFALQNLLSALCCVLLGVLLYRIGRVLLDPGASLAVASVTLFGSSLISSLATGLWNADYAILFLALGLLHVVRGQVVDTARLHLGYLALLAGLAYICRPTAAFAILAGVLTVLPMAGRAKRLYWLLLAALLALAALLIGLDLAGWIPRYYSPLKLTPRTPVLNGLYGIALSPSRGLLVWSPFLVLVLVGSVRFFSALAANRLFRLAVVWSGFHLLAVATKGAWWGGHSYGPRLLAEVLLPAALATCLAWREAKLGSGPRARSLLAASYLVCGLLAVYIHSYQGLFNPHARRWNWTPDLDRDPRLAFDWRYPQFLASDRSLEDRVFERERLELGTYRLGDEIPYDGGDAIFRDWYQPEDGWRWSRGQSAEILLRLGELPSRGLYLLRLRVASLGRQEIGLEVNGTGAGRIDLDGGEARERVFVLAPDRLRPGQENSFRFDIPGATATATDSRVLGLALYTLRLDSLLIDGAGVSFGDEPFFVRGFSVAESGWRWTDGDLAMIDYPLAAVAEVDTLEIVARALVDQPVEIRLNGAQVGDLHVPGGFVAVTRRLTFDPALLQPQRMNRIEISISQAQRTADDARLLGLAFVRLELRPWAPGDED